MLFHPIQGHEFLKFGAIDTSLALNLISEEGDEAQIEFEGVKYTILDQPFRI